MAGGKGILAVDYGQVERTQQMLRHLLDGEALQCRRAVRETNRQVSGLHYASLSADGIEAELEELRERLEDFSDGLSQYVRRIREWDRSFAEALLPLMEDAYQPPAEAGGLGQSVSADAVSAGLVLDDMEQQLSIGARVFGFAGLPPHLTAAVTLAKDSDFKALMMEGENGEAFRRFQNRMEAWFLAGGGEKGLAKLLPGILLAVFLPLQGVSKPEDPRLDPEKLARLKAIGQREAGIKVVEPGFWEQICAAGRMPRENIKKLFAKDATWKEQLHGWYSLISVFDELEAMSSMCITALKQIPFLGSGYGKWGAGVEKAGDWVEKQLSRIDVTKLAASIFQVTSPFGPIFSYGTRDLAEPFYEGMLVDGAGGLAKGLVQIAARPLETVAGMGRALNRPDFIGQQLWDHIKNTWNQIVLNGTNEERARLAGKITFELVMLYVQVGQIKNAVGAEKTLSLLDDWVKLGNSADELVMLGVTMEDIAKSGVTVSQLLKSGYSTKDILLLGGSVDDLLRAQVSVNAILAAGGKVEDLLKANQTIPGLMQQGVSLEALLRGGASADEIAKATGLPVGSAFGPMDNIDDILVYYEFSRRSATGEWAIPVGMTADEYAKYLKGLWKVADEGAGEIEVLYRKKKSPNYIEPMPKKQLQKIVKGFKRQGGIIQMDSATDAHLLVNNAEGVCIGSDTILLRQKPGRASVFEELIHSTQYRQGLIDSSLESILRNEIAAQEMLLRNSRAYKLTPAEILQTQSALKSYIQQLEALIGGAD